MPKKQPKIKRPVSIDVEALEKATKLAAERRWSVSSAINYMILNFKEK